MAHSPDFATVLLSQSGAVATLTLNRPHRRNALDSQLLQDLRGAMAAVAADESVRTIVLTGAGTSFCAGLDLRELGSSGDNIRMAGPASGDHSPWAAHTKPVVGAVNGPTATGGLEIALHCDFLVAAESAAFADTHARVGVLPGWGLSYLLPQAVGVRRAREMSLTGRMVPASEAYVWGLVNHVVPDEELMATAGALGASAAEVDPAMCTEFMALYADNVASTTVEAVRREARRSRDWLPEHFSPADVAGRAGAVISRGSAQR